MVKYLVEHGSLSQDSQFSSLLYFFFHLVEKISSHLICLPIPMVMPIYVSLFMYEIHYQNSDRSFKNTVNIGTKYQSFLTVKFHLLNRVIAIEVKIFFH